MAYEGTLLQLTLGEKGSYLYAAFGAPLAHENDIERAVTAALALCLLPIQLESIASVSIGLSWGTMRTGAYGSTTRRTYGVLGDEVNLAARLMQRAAPGQVLASESVWQTAGNFDWQMLPPFKAKGKRVPVTPAALIGRKERERLSLPQTTAMIGRQAELELIEERLELARQRQGQIVSITGEAGMGKSRLLAEALKRVGNLMQYSGECQSYGTQSSYLVWHSIWQAFFGLDPTSTTIEQIETLERALAGFNSDFPLRLPLLGAALNLSIPDNGLTSAMDARARKTSRESLLVDCIRARANEIPLVLVLEDLHWIDPLSRDLLEGIGRAIKELPVLILLAYRPPHHPDALTGAEAETTFLPGLTDLEYVAEVHLSELTQAEIGQLVAAWLAHFGLDGDVPPTLVERLSARAQGNPFYIEELLNYLHDSSFDPRLEASWEHTDLPDSLNSLILSRIDRLAEHQQITIKTASIIGRLFKAAWLYEYYPPLGGSAQVAADLEALNRLEFTLLETPEPQLTYLFKHVITQEAAYESLAYTTRTSLHEQFARYLELAAGEDIGPFLDLLAYHYERSENLPKKREYLRKAGEAAQKAFANETSISYLGRALALAPESDYAGRFDIITTRERVYHILGKREAQNQDLTLLAALAERLNDNKRRAHAAVSQSIYANNTSNYPAAITAAQQVVALAHLTDSNEDQAQGYRLWGEALRFQGNYVEAHARYEQALSLAQTAQLIGLTATILMNLGSVDLKTGNYDSVKSRLERALQLQRQVGNRIGETSALYLLGDCAYINSNFSQAEAYYEQSLHAWHSIGYRVSEGRALSRISNLIIEQRGDYAKARGYADQALSLAQGSGDRVNEIMALYDFSLIHLMQNNYRAARLLAEQALHICHEIGFKIYEAACLAQIGDLAGQLGEYASNLEYQHLALALLRKMGERDGICQVLTALGMAFYYLGQYKATQEYNQEALSIAQETKNKLMQNRALTLQGHTFRELGDLDGATNAYQQAFRLAMEIGLQHFAKQAQTGLAAIALAQGNLAEAQAPMDEILGYLETTPILSSIDEIFWIYLTCYHILHANYDPRAESTLQAAYKLLQEIAAGIDDESLRVSFLQNVHSNREIVALWEGLAGADHKKRERG